MLAQCSEKAQKEQIKSVILTEFNNILAEKNLDNISFSIQFIQKIKANKITGKKLLIVQHGDAMN